MLLWHKVHLGPLIEMTCYIINAFAPLISTLLVSWLWRCENLRETSGNLIPHLSVVEQGREVGGGETRLEAAIFVIYPSRFFCVSCPGTRDSTKQIHQNSHHLVMDKTSFWAVSCPLSCTRSSVSVAVLVGWAVTVAGLCQWGRYTIYNYIEGWIVQQVKGETEFLHLYVCVKVFMSAKLCLSICTGFMWFMAPVMAA